MKITLEAILEARRRIRSGIICTPCPESLPLSQAVGCRVFCKMDYLQRTGSFKERGARNALLLLDAEARQRGVIAASAGNHALGLAYHGRELGIGVTVVMPTTSPLTKVANCRALGANVILHGEFYSDARTRSLEMAQSSGLTYIHGFDDPAVIAGQGTCGLEILEQVPEVDAVIVPVGGGGLIAGIARVFKSLKPSVRIVGVEPQNAASFAAAMAAGKPVAFEIRPTLADGLAVSQVGVNALDTAEGLIDSMLSVSEASIALAVLRLIELHRGVVEGAGAAGLSALLENKTPELTGKNVVLVLAGGNIDTPVLGRIIDRGLAADGRLCRFVARISDRPGGLAKFAGVIAEAGASIKDIAHDRAFSGADPGSTNVICVVETHNAQHIESLKERLTAAGFMPEFR